MIIIHLTFYFKNILRQGFKPKNGLKNYMENYVLMQILKSQEWAEPINLCSIKKTMQCYRSYDCSDFI